MTKEQLVGEIIDLMDTMRLDCFGGYPSEHVIENGRVYWADYADNKDYAMVDLKVHDIDDFIEKFIPDEGEAGMKDYEKKVKKLKKKRNKLK